MDMFEDEKVDIFKSQPQQPVKKNKSKVVLIAVVVVLIAIFSISAFFAGFLTGKQDTFSQKAPFAQTILDAIEKYYVDDIDWNEFQYIVAQAMANSVDNFTGLIEATPVGMQTLSAGINMQLNDYNQYFISYVSPGSPASQATPVSGIGVDSLDDIRLQRGDEIYAVNGVVIQHLPLSKAQSIISDGKENVSYTILRYNADGEVAAKFEFEITKTVMHAPVAFYLDGNDIGLGDDVGYVYLAEFGDTAVDDFAQAMTDFVSDPTKPSNLILDLRNNGGGASDILGFIASYFVKDAKGNTSGVPMARYYYNAGNGNMQETYFFTQNTIKSATDEQKTLTSFNLYDKVENFDCVVLTNGSSASSSEILTAIIKHYCNEQSIGATTYGKGVAQVSFTYENSKYMLYVTNGKYYIPTYNENGQTIFEKTIHNVGIAPDIEVKEGNVLPYDRDLCILNALMAFQD